MLREIIYEGKEYITIMCFSVWVSVIRIQPNSFAKSIKTGKKSSVQTELVFSAYFCDY